MFLKFSIFYGHIWRSQFKNEHFLNLARQGWQEALDEFDEALIDTAIDESFKQREMPPTLAQFIDCNRSGGVLCRTAIIESLRSNDRSSTQYPT